MWKDQPRHAVNLGHRRESRADCRCPRGIDEDVVVRERNKIAIGYPQASVTSARQPRTLLLDVTYPSIATEALFKRTLDVRARPRAILDDNDLVWTGDAGSNRLNAGHHELGVRARSQDYAQQWLPRRRVAPSCAKSMGCADARLRWHSDRLGQRRERHLTIRGHRQGDPAERAIVLTEKSQQETVWLTSSARGKLEHVYRALDVDQPYGDRRGLPIAKAL